MATSETWRDPTRCPFCGDQLSSPGIGFYDHIDSTTACKRRHEQWVERVGNDIRGGWSG
jgi:hypothetical protein